MHHYISHAAARYNATHVQKAKIYSKSSEIGKSYMSLQGDNLNGGAVFHIKRFGEVIQYGTVVPLMVVAPQ